MTQHELPLETDLLGLMARKKPKIAWRRAHERVKNGRSVRVGLTIMNNDRGEQEKMLRKQLPESAKKPIRSDKRHQIDLEI